MDYTSPDLQATDYQSLLATKLAELRQLALNANINLDTSLGSLAWFATAANSLESSNLYAELASAYNNMFADTADRPFLIRLCLERGLRPFPASAATFQVSFDVNVPVGSRFSQGELTFVTTSQTTAMSEGTGSQYNNSLGRIFPLQVVPQLRNAFITELLIPGEDDEDTEALRARYFRSVSGMASNGNIAAYYDWTMAQAGVGACRVARVSPTAGSSTIYVLDSNYQPASNLLLEQLKQACDPEDYSNEGVGFASINQRIFFAAPSTLDINITADFIVADNTTFDGLAGQITQIVQEQLITLTKQWDQLNWIYQPGLGLVIIPAIIQVELLKITGILAINNFQINGTYLNINLDALQIPGTITVTDNLTNSEVTDDPTAGYVLNDDGTTNALYVDDGSGTIMPLHIIEDGE